MKGFCKVFETGEYGQVLLKRDTNGEDRPEIRLYFQPDIEQFGVWSVAIAFGKDESADDAFDKFTVESVEEILKVVFSTTGIR